MNTQKNQLFQSQSQAPIQVGMIGPVVASWGGPPRTGGVSTYVHGLASTLSAAGVEVSLLGDNTDASTGLPVARPPAEIHFSPMYRLSATHAPGTIRRLGVQRLIRMGVNLAQVREVNVPFGQQIRYLDRAANYDRFLSQIHAQILHVAHAEFRQYLVQRIVRTRLPVVASVLSATVFLRTSTPEWLVKLTTMNYNRAARLLACSYFVKDAIQSYVEDADRIQVVPNGTDVRRFHPGSQEAARRALGLESNQERDSFVLLFTGHLVRPKGVLHLLEAFGRSLAGESGARLVYVGSGPEAETIRSQSAQLGIANQVILAGYRPDAELPDWYRASDVFALPSESEGLSTSVLEAMACARPVLTTYNGFGRHDAISDGVNGFLFEYGEVGKLAELISTLFHKRELSRRMGDAGRKKAEANFAWPVIARQVVDIYREILSKQP